MPDECTVPRSPERPLRSDQIYPAHSLPPPGEWRLRVRFRWPHLSGSPASPSAHAFRPLHARYHKTALARRLGHALSVRRMTLIYLVAGEASGDVLGARLMRAIHRRQPDVQFAGIGGSQMIAEGLSSLFPMHDLALVGLLEVLPRLGHLRQRLRQTVDDIAARKPDTVVTIDSPGFTLRLLRAIQSFGIRRIHYVAPQVWAWRESRVRHYPGLWDQLLCLLPFEPAFFARHNLPATFVGHPVLESGADTGDATRFRQRHKIDPGARILTLMPGSRRTEVKRLLPILGATLQRLPDLVPVVPIAGTVAEAVRDGTSEWKHQPLLVT